MNDNLLTVDEVAKRLRVSRAWLTCARRQGRFAPEIQLGRRVVFSEAAIAEWLAEQMKSRQAA